MTSLADQFAHKIRALSPFNPLQLGDQLIPEALCPEFKTLGGMLFADKKSILHTFTDGSCVIINAPQKTMRTLSLLRAITTAETVLRLNHLPLNTLDDIKSIYQTLKDQPYADDLQINEYPSSDM